MTYDVDDWKSIIPMYLNGSLDQYKRAAFEERLRNDPELEKEFKLFQCIQIESEAHRPDFNGLFSKIEDRISDSNQADVPVESNKLPIKEQLQRFFAFPALSWGLVAAQFAVIAILLLPFFDAAREQQIYETLSPSEYPANNTYARKVNIIFRDETNISEVQTLLSSVGASIISGPSDTRNFVIGLTDKSNIEEQLAVLRQSSSVKLAELAY